MPGLSQIQKFCSDLISLGNEPEIRAARGEQAAPLPIPATIEDKNDSDDFKLGMPSVSEEEIAQAEAAAQEKEKNAGDLSDITGENQDEDTTGNVVQSVMPNVSDLLSPDASDINLDDLDLSDFEDTPVVEEQKPKVEEKPKEIPIEDLDLDALLAPKSKPEPKPAPQPAPQPQPKPAQPKPAQAVKPAAPKPQPKPAAPKAAPSPFDIPDLPDFDFESKNASSEKEDLDSGLEDLDSLEEIPETIQEQEPAPVQEKTPDLDDDFGSDSDFSFEGSGIDLTTDLPEQLNEKPDEPLSNSSSNISSDDFDFGDALEQKPAFDASAADDFSPSENAGSTTEEAAPSMDDMFKDTGDTGPASAGDFNMPDDDLMSMDFGSFGSSTDSDSGIPSETSDDFGGIDLQGSAPSSQDIPSDDQTADAGSSAGEFDPSAFTENFADTSGLFDQDDSGSVPESSGPVETVDTSAINDLDFSAGGSDSGDDFSDTDFALNTSEDDLFNIPGFSDTTTAEMPKKQKVDTPDFTGARQDETKQKNTFTDSEYKRFLENLSQYPLNVRIALEDLVVRNEFTDDAVFAILDKVLRKVPARQLAGDLEKMLDITLDVPRDYERRTAAEYEQYKQSLEYQLKNKIIPVAIATAFAAVMVFCIGFLTKMFIWDPAIASSLYKKGYKELQRNEYVASGEYFNRATETKLIKKWFYKYAEGYRTHRQYERATEKYKQILANYNHEKQAGLDWASMEMYDLFNYEEAERILKREVLDYHINDADAILLLGDDYLEWGTEKDPEKLERAKEQYAVLLQLYGDKEQNVYLSRMLKYYIRTDDLREVLGYKEYFFPLKNKGLDGKSWTELSGYLFEKRYGNLKPSEEQLRFNIEDVREMLTRAIKYDSENPVAQYNIGRYFCETQDETSAKKSLNYALDLFKKQDLRSKRDTYKYINTYRLLGESYLRTKEYILAENNFTQGISLFENENQASDFESDQNVGKIYEDLGELNYFVSGDLDEAQRNYENAINNKDDNAVVRYRVGYIQYNKQNYQAALGSFILSSESRGSDMHLLLSLADTFSQRRDNNAAQGYYEKLIDQLEKEFALHELILPQVREDQADLVDTYMKAQNNLGVTLHRIAEATGNSNANGKAIVSLTESLRAWDALTRNQTTMVRLEGSNLAEQNIKYITHPSSEYEPAIYTEIPRTLSDEKGLQ